VKQHKCHHMYVTDDKAECCKNPDVAILILKNEIIFDNFKNSVRPMRSLVEYDEIKRHYGDEWIKQSPFMILGWMGMMMFYDMIC